MRLTMTLAAAALTALVTVAEGQQSRTFTFAADDFEPAAGTGPISGRVTAPVGLGGSFRSGQVDAIELSVGGVTYSPAGTTYEYDPSVDRLSIRGEGEGQAGFDLQIRQASAPEPGSADFTFYSADGNYHAAGEVRVTAGGR
jgi:hypothetical protein